MTHCSPVATFAVTALFAFVGTWIILKVIDATVGLRIGAEDEQRGLDLSRHEERAYSGE